MILAAASVSTSGSYSPTNWHTYLVYCCIFLLHAVGTSIGTRALARLQTVYTVICTGLALATIIALAAATPADLRNPASYALVCWPPCWSDAACRTKLRSHRYSEIRQGGWYNETGWSGTGAFILSMLMPAWTIASYDSCIHISEEASNAATAVPMVGAELPSGANASKLQGLVDSLCDRNVLFV